MTCRHCGQTLSEGTQYCSRCGRSVGEREHVHRDGDEPTIIPVRLNDTFEGKWKLESKLGEGGMGVVYLAQDLQLERAVAVKILASSLLSDPEVVSRFEREARLTASLEHPNIVPVYAVGRHEGRPFMVMKKLEGHTLSQILRQKGTLTLSELLLIMQQLCAGLDFIHSRGYVHRDIKTGNIFISPDGHATILDFGILRVRGKEVLTRAGAVMGTPQYMSPEQALGLEDVDHRADLYALAVVLFECLTGSLPFDTSSDLELIQAHAHTPPPDPTQFLPSIPRSIAEVVVRALAKRREDRYPSAAELLTALEAAAAGHVPPGVGDLPADPNTVPSWRRRAATPKPAPDAPPASAKPTPAEGVRAAPARAGVPVPWPTTPVASRGRAASSDSVAAAPVPVGVASSTSDAKRPRRAILFTLAAAGLLLAVGSLYWVRPSALAEAMRHPANEAEPLTAEGIPLSLTLPLEGEGISEQEATYIDASVDLSEYLAEAQALAADADAGSGSSTGDAGWSLASADPRATSELRLVEVDDPQPRSTVKARRVGKKASAYGKLNVITLHRGEPYWAEVKIDGVVRGRSPLLLELPVGSHVIRVERAGFASQQREINVASGQGAVLRIRLTP